MTTGQEAKCCSRLDGGPERGALFLANVVDDHLLVRRQWPRAAHQLLDGELTILLADVSIMRRHASQCTSPWPQSTGNQGIQPLVSTSTEAMLRLWPAQRQPRIPSFRRI